MHRCDRLATMHHMLQTIDRRTQHRSISATIRVRSAKNYYRNCTKNQSSNFNGKKMENHPQTPHPSTPSASRPRHSTNQRTLLRLLFWFCLSSRV